VGCLGGGVFLFECLVFVAWFGVWVGGWFLVFVCVVWLVVEVVGFLLVFFYVGFGGCIWL